MTTLPTTGVLFGARTVIDGKLPEHDLSGVYQREQQLGRRYSIVTTFRAFTDTYQSEIELAQTGRIPQISWPVRGTYPGHAAILTGRYDSTLRIEATKWDQIPGNILIRPFWEMNGQSYGTDPEGTRAAWNHIWTVMKPRAPRSSWVWCVQPRPSIADHRWAEFMPDHDKFAWCSIDAYDKNPADRYLSDILHQGNYYHPAQNDDWYAQMSAIAGKHLMVSEGGQREPTDPTNEKPATINKPQWWYSVPTGLKTLPRVKAVVLWDVTSSGGDWRFDTTSVPGQYDIAGPTFQAVKAAVNDPYLNPVPL